MPATPASQPVLRFLGSPERLLVAGEQSGGEFALFQAAGAPPDRAALAALAAGHGIDIAGPGLTLGDYVP